MLCPNCGSDNTGKFCSKCGLLLVEQTCPKCGASFFGNTCPACGQKLAYDGALADGQAQSIRAATANPIDTHTETDLHQEGAQNGQLVTEQPPVPAVLQEEEEKDSTQSPPAALQNQEAAPESKPEMENSSETGRLAEDSNGHSSTSDTETRQTRQNKKIPLWLAALIVFAVLFVLTSFLSKLILSPLLVVSMGATVVYLGMTILQSCQQERFILPDFICFLASLAVFLLSLYL